MADDQTHDAPPPPIIASRFEIAEEIREQVPGLDDFLRDVPGELRFVIASVTKVDSVPDGFRRLITQAVSEMFDLMFAITTGEGRSAFKASRSLLDLLIAGLDVTSSDAAMERYTDHRLVVLHQAALLDQEERRLQGNERRSAAHARRKAIRDSSREHDVLLAQHGASFARRWHEGSIKDRADAHGLTEDYEFFRLASAVLHGSGGGIIGLYAEPDGIPTLRTGPALSLCPIAFVLGLDYFDRLIALAGTYEDVVGVDAVRRTVAAARDLWPTYRRVLYTMDAAWWHHAPRHDVITLLVIFPYGGKRWYLHDPMLGMVRRARPPTLPPEQAARFEEFATEAREHVSDATLLRQPVSIAILGVRVEADETAPWEHAGRVLVQPLEMNWNAEVTPDRPRTLTRDPETGKLNIA